MHPVIYNGRSGSERQEIIRRAEITGTCPKSPCYPSSPFFFEKHNEVLTITKASKVVHFVLMGLMAETKSELLYRKVIMSPWMNLVPEESSLLSDKFDCNTLLLRLMYIFVELVTTCDISI